MAWTDERVALLKQYWDEGRSASQIAELLGEKLSRNAVIGKAHRLGLAARPSPLKAAKSAAPAAGNGTARTTTAQPAAPAPAAAAPAATAEPARKPAAAVPTRAEPTIARPSPEPVAPVAPAPAPRQVPVVDAAVSRPVRPVSPPDGKARGKDGKVSLLDLNDRICKWPIGHPDEADFHFCGKPVNPGFPYCGDHCLVAYQAQLPRGSRPSGPPRPFGPNLPRPR
ncbi:MAG: GcrA family cell cycle regulator [Sphingomonadaceae bacterium]